jgi:DNA-binding CsgD family transcriptional regulator
MIPQTAITERDFRTMLRIVAAPDDVGSPYHLPWSVLTGLKELIPCDNISFNMFDADEREIFFDQEVNDLPLPSQSAEGMDAAFLANYSDSQRCPCLSIPGDFTSVSTLSDFHSDCELRFHPIHRAYWGVVERKMTLYLPSQPGHVMRLVFFRGPGPDFSPRDRGLLTLLRPHLYESYREQRRRRRGTPQLTDRQRQLLRLVAVGHTNGQVARRLSISEATVRKHLEHIFERLQVTSRTAAVTRTFGDEQ